MSTLIDQGNEQFRQKKYPEAIQLYTEALQSSLPSSDAIRAYNNRSQCYINQKQYEQALQDADSAIALDPKNGKAAFRKIGCMENLKAPLQQILQEFQRSIGQVTDEKDRETLVQKKKLFYESNKLAEIEDFIETASTYIARPIVSSKQLQYREVKQYHDTWKVHDYFDATTELKYVPCPPQNFAPNEPERTEEQKSKLLHSYPLTVAAPHPVSADFYYKYAQGTAKLMGCPNVAVARLLLKMQHQGKTLVLFGRKVTFVGIHRGNVRTKDINFFNIGKGGVVVRDMDPHVWIAIKLAPANADVSSTSTGTQDEEILLDFIPSQFDYSEYHHKTLLPLRLFNKDILKQEYETFNATKNTTVYRIKQELFDKEARQYIDMQYIRDYPIESHIQTVYSTLLVKLQEYLENKGHLKKVKLF